MAPYLLTPPTDPSAAAIKAPLPHSGCWRVERRLPRRHHRWKLNRGCATSGPRL